MYVRGLLKQYRTFLDSNGLRLFDSLMYSNERYLSDNLILKGPWNDGQVEELEVIRRLKEWLNQVQNF